MRNEFYSCRSNPDGSYGHDDSMTQLKKLKELLDSEAITQEEYQEKKKKYLDRM
ncbi:MAG TPA: SHOCT domain-containing protein [Nitrososphaerales archaeon]